MTYEPGDVVRYRGIERSIEAVRLMRGGGQHVRLRLGGGLLSWVRGDRVEFIRHGPRLPLRKVLARRDAGWGEPVEVKA